MNILINNEPIQLGGDTSIPQLLTLLKIKQFDGLAVAVDEQVIKKSEWENHKIQENQKVTIITAFQGG